MVSAGDVPEEVFSTVPSSYTGPRGPFGEPSSSAAAPTVSVVTVNDMPASTRDAHLEGMRKMFRVMGIFPHSILNSNKNEAILAFFQGLISQGQSGVGPGGSPGP